MHIDSFSVDRTTLRNTVVTALALAVALWAGWWAGSRSPTEPLLVLLAIGVLLAIARYPRVWLVLLVVLTAFRSYDNVLVGGFLSWSKLLTLAMMAVYGARVMTGRARLHVFREWLLPLVLLLGWAVASILWAFDRALALETVVSWLSLSVLQGLIYTLFKDDFRAVEIAVYVHIVTMTVFSFVWLYAVLLAPESEFARSVMGSPIFEVAFGQRVGRFFGFYADPNAVAMMLNYAIFLVLVLVSAGRSAAGSPHTGRILLILVWFLTVALVNTYSRSGLAAFLIGMVYLVYRRGVDTYTLTSLVGAGGLAYLFREGIVVRFEELPYTGWGIRLSELKLGMMEFLAAPITGIGLGSFRSRLRAMGISVFRGETPVIHNTYLKFLVELGLPGLLLLVWFCVVLVRRYRRNSQLADRAVMTRLHWMNVGFGACFLGTSVFALPLGVAEFNTLWILFGLFAVTSAAIERTCRGSASC